MPRYIFGGCTFSGYTFAELKEMANYLGCLADIEDILREGSHLTSIDTANMSYEFFCKCEHFKPGSKASRLAWIQEHMRAEKGKN